MKIVDIFSDDFCVAGPLHVPLMLRIHRGDQQLPGPRGLRVRQHPELRVWRGERRDLNVSTKQTFYCSFSVPGCSVCCLVTCAKCEYCEPRASDGDQWPHLVSSGEIPPAVIFRSPCESIITAPSVQIIIATSHFTCAKLYRMGSWVIECYLEKPFTLCRLKLIPTKHHLTNKYLWSTLCNSNDAEMEWF